MTLAVHRSSKLIPDFVLHRPETLEEALSLSRQFGATASFMAGGVSLINVMKTGVAVGNVIHLGRLPSFRTMTIADNVLRVGAGVTLWQFQTSPHIGQLDPGVACAVAQIGNVRIRMKGTLGGNIMAREPNFDVLPVMMALGAQLRFADVDGAVRQMPADALGWRPGSPPVPEGLLLDLSLPLGGPAWFGYDRSLRPALTLAVGIEVTDGRPVAARIGIACAYSQPFFDRIPLSSVPPAGAAAATLARDWASNLPEPLEDAAASARYRRHLMAVLMRRQFDAFAAHWAATH